MSTLVHGQMGLWPSNGKSETVSMSLQRPVSTITSQKKAATLDGSACLIVLAYTADTHLWQK